MNLKYIRKMNAPTLFILPDRPITNQLHLEDLSDQTMMEAAIEMFPERLKELFKDPNGEYKDVCKWMGVKCSGRRRVESIQWVNEFRDSMSNGSEMDLYSACTFFFDLLPRALKKFHVHTRDDITTHFWLFWCLETGSLPRTLIKFQASGQRIVNTVDFTRMPPNLEFFDIRSNRCGGKAQLTNLPPELQYFHIAGNTFLGSLDLCHLPPRLKDFNVADNRFCGCLNLACLPDSLEFLDVSTNHLEGSVYLDKLPLQMKVLYLNENGFSGEVIMQMPPPNIRVVDLQINAFSGTAVIARCAWDRVVLNCNKITWLMDETGRGHKYVEKTG